MPYPSVGRLSSFHVAEAVEWRGSAIHWQNILWIIRDPFPRLSNSTWQMLQMARRPIRSGQQSPGSFFNFVLPAANFLPRLCQLLLFRVAVPPAKKEARLNGKTRRSVAVGSPTRAPIRGKPLPPLRGS